MWRRKKVAKSDGQEDIQAAESKKPEICTNCIKLMQENSQLKEQLAVLQGEGRKKQYTINPTLYTFYKNNVQKNRISRQSADRRFLISRAASQITRGLLDVEEEEDKGEYNEEIITQCAKPMPNTFFMSDDFLEAFENQCNQVSKY